MELTFLGHQTWLIQVNNSAILIDPLLMPTFGASDGSKCAVYPFREIDLSALPIINGIFLSHEHPDHVCFDTLSRLPKDIPVFVGPLMLNSVLQGLRALDREVVIFDPLESLSIGEITITPFHASEDTPYWENRVYQFLIEDQKKECGSYLAVDAGFSEKFESYYEKNKIKRPDLIIVSNNSQVKNNYARTAFENANIEFIENPVRNGPMHLEIVKSLTVDYVEKFPETKSVAICGGGFLKGDLDFESIRSDYFKPSLEKLLQDQDFSSLLVPSPGQTISISINEIQMTSELKSYVSPLSNTEFAENYSWKAKNDNINNKLFFPCFEDDEVEITSDLVAEIEKEWSEFSDTFSFSRIGQDLLAQIQEQRLSSVFSVNLLCSKTDRTLISMSFDLNSTGISSQKCSNKELSLNMYLNDFMAVLNGKIEIWDLSGAHIEGRCYRFPDVPMITYLYAFYGEHVRQDLSLRALKRKLNTMGVELS